MDKRKPKTALEYANEPPPFIVSLVLLAQAGEPYEFKIMKMRDEASNTPALSMGCSVAHDICPDCVNHLSNRSGDGQR